MTLMFPRIARNFAKKGYYPTDGGTIERVLQALDLPLDGEVRVFDPCCGEGVALAEIKHQLDPSRVTAFGIELDEERAWHSKTMLDTVIHADMQDCAFGQQQYGLLWLNPPYGDLVADRGQTGTRTTLGRLEKLFYQRSIASLQYGGVLVLIVPRSVLDKQYCGWLAKSFERLQAFQAVDQQFRQVVLIGIRRRQGTFPGAGETYRRLLAWTGKADDDDGPDMVEELKQLPETWTDHRYILPPAPGGPIKFYSARIDQRQLHDETARFPCLWHRFDLLFTQIAQTPRRPLAPLSSWHLALALAAGQVSGLVRGQDGRQFVVRGDTFKTKEVREEFQETPSGSVQRIVTKTDKFVPVIRALDVTPGSPTFGETLVIQ